MNQLSCHLIGFNPFSKKEFIEKINNKLFNIIDLDSINQDIIKDKEMDKMYTLYMKLKGDKNDKFKEVDKKMSTFWETNFVQKVEDKIKQKKVNILIGMNNHYKSMSRRVPIECTNKFIVKNDIEEDVSMIIKYNLENYKDDIIAGSYPLDYINREFLIKKRNSINTIYSKLGYIEKTPDQLKKIINLIEKTNHENMEIYISMKEPYNVGSLIHPTKDLKVIGYNNSKNAILSSIEFDKEVKDLKMLDKKDHKKLKTKRFLYLVENDSFIPDEDKNVYFSQQPVKIISKEKIDNVIEYFGL